MNDMFTRSSLGTALPGGSSAVSIDANGALTRLVGTVAVGDAESLLAAAEAAVARGLDARIEASELTHLDGAAVQVLLALKAKLAREGRTLHLTDLPEQLSTLLSVCGFRDLTEVAA